MEVILKHDPDLEQPYHFVFVAGNGEVVAVSENYFNKADAMRAIHLIQAHASSATLIEE